MTKEPDLMEKIISLAKRRGFVFQGSEIYGGLAGTWDYGPLGVALKRNILSLWREIFVENRSDILELDAAILMSPKVWEASGHVGGFSDPLVECKKCKRRFRADQLEDAKVCPECNGELGEARQFNMMFKTHVGASEDAQVSYLRPETAQGIFVNFKNILDTFHPSLPFGVAQVGKAFRNEISPRDFLFRVREFDLMEVEYFVKEGDWQRAFEEWVEMTRSWFKSLGLASESVHEIEVAESDRAHYSKRTVDFEFDYPFGQKELAGLAYRGDFDLSSHETASGASLTFYDEETKERFHPHVIEPSFGLDRTILAVLSNSYREDEMGGETRTYLALPHNLAPVRVAVFPLLKNKPDLIAKAKEVFAIIKKEFPSAIFDDNGNIGKRYRRQDEIGTPYCVTIDFDTLEDGTVTVRDSDSGEQKRVSQDELLGTLS